MQPPGDLLKFPHPFRRSQHDATPSTPSPDAAVIATNSDAATSKASCVRAGYYSDDFLRHFLDVAPSFSSTSSSSLPKRPPLINRGYFCRHAAVSGLVAAFLSRVASSSSSSPPPRSQIVSLGAGSDTLFFRLHAAGRAPSLYVELDLPEVVSRKAGIISSTPELAARVSLPPAAPSSSKIDRIVTSRYALLPCDLRSASPISTAIRRAQEAGSSSTSPPSSSRSPPSSSRFAFDASAPTLFISECVLVYLPPSAGDEVIRDAFEMLSGGGGGSGGSGGGGAIVVYDPCRPGTAFGRQMATNLRARGCDLLGIEATPDPRGAVARLRRFGWECVYGGDSKDSSSADLRTVWERHLPAESRALASSIEQLDELEEWHLIMEHYFLAVGVKRGGGGNEKVLDGFGLASLTEEKR